MSNYYYGAPHHFNTHSPASSSHHHHGGRSRRGPRLAGNQNSHKHPHRTARALKEAPIPEAPAAVAFRREFEAARSFDLEDDEMFCPFTLLTEDDLHSIQSSPSDRSSLSSGSPESSPLQPQIQPSAGIALSSTANPYTPAAGYHHQQVQQHMKLHQPLAQRSRNAIPIVDPSTNRNITPEPSVSPARQIQQQLGRRW